MSFVLGWLTPEEASPLGVPWEIAQGFFLPRATDAGYVSPRHTVDKHPYNWLLDSGCALAFEGDAEA